MYRTGFRRNYAHVVGTPPPGGGGVGGGGGEQGGVRYLSEEERRKNLKLKDHKYKLFKERLEMEGNRTKMGGGNQLKFLRDGGGQCEVEEVGNLLRVLGFKKEEVKGIQENVFRPSEIEVTFEEDVELNMNEIENKLRERKVPFVPAKFKHREEVLMVYGLPFVKDIEKLKEELKDAVRAFVGKIVECSPTYYQNNDQRGEYFRGKLTGAWRLKVVPKKDIGIPNFIVVGKEKVQGKVTYTNKTSVRITQCANCFSEEHLMNDGSCQGIRRWSNYCKEFEERWQNAVRVPVDTKEEETARADIISEGMK